MNGAVDLNNPVKYKVKGNSKSLSFILNSLYRKRNRIS